MVIEMEREFGIPYVHKEGTESEFAKINPFDFVDPIEQEAWEEFERWVTVDLRNDIQSKTWIDYTVTPYKIRVLSYWFTGIGHQLMCSGFECGLNTPLEVLKSAYIRHLDALIMHRLNHPETIWRNNTDAQYPLDHSKASVSRSEPSGQREE